VIDGSVTIADESLSKRDGIGIWNSEEVTLTADANAELLLIEVPMI
jgi:redox-sensitive bicupin YhaK (pirin superfamily)